ncbi:MAG: C40 family peptidase [Enterocloster asparagiformis]|nr:C40 family peptidase [Enterocloster asparagiformis]
MSMNIRKMWFTYRYKLALAAAMACAGVAIGALSEQWTPVRPAVPVPVETRPGGSVPAGTMPAKATPAQAAATPDSASPAQAEAGKRPDILNLAELYPEGYEEGGPGAASFAEQIYAVLSAREAQWNSEIYDLYNQTPASVAARLGMPADQLLGKYNPEVEGQNPADPSTWTVPEFGGIQVSYLNGDGAAAEWRSNIKDIMAMTNVYQYYEPDSGLETLEAYALGLWSESHGYACQISPVYYCEGCLEETVDGDTGGEAGSAAAPEAVEAAGTGGDESVSGSDTAANTDGAGDPTGIAASEEQGTALGGTGADASASTAESQAESASVPETGDEAARTEADGIENSGADGREQVIVEGVDGGPGVTALPAGLSTAEEETSSHEYVCPGHVDLQIQLQVAGLTENNSLFALDSHGNAPEQIREDGWPDWNAENRGYVRTLADEDWYERYGLTVDGVVVRNPLTALDIDLYMKMVPEDVSAQRRSVVRYALSSVGRIPYYWGGKPGKTGYEGNRFGVVVLPDEDGRFLKGLDCSGWINWVYWSATGKRLAGESTSTLVSCGTAVSKDELLPGDICIRPGESAHVVMFLGWTADQKMLCIQETSGNINNVEVGITVPDWPHYRRLID